MKNLFSSIQTKKARILIIDDEEDICHYLKSILEKTKKFEVYTSYNPLEAVELAKEMEPDLILLDIIMPQIDGEEVANRLQEDESTKDILVVFFSVLVKQEEVKQFEGKIGGHLFIPKPIENSELIARIESILEEAHIPAK